LLSRLAVAHARLYSKPPGEKQSNGDVSMSSAGCARIAERTLCARRRYDAAKTA